MAQVSRSAGPMRSPNPGPANPSVALFLVSVLGLFLELMLIRWVGTEVRIFAYLQNTVLVVCFMGLGMGCLTSGRPAQLGRMLWPLLGLVLLMAVPTTRTYFAGISDRLRALGDLVIWGEEVKTSAGSALGNVGIGLGLTFILSALIWAVFVPIGRRLGRLLEEHPRTIWAYSVNVAGSLVGIWLFVALSALEWPPVAWFTVAVGLALLFVDRPGLGRIGELVAAAGVVGLAWVAGFDPDAIEVRWSPYQKLAVRRGSPDPHEVVVNVNNIGYQVMLDLSDEHVAFYPERYPPEMHGLSQYDLPYRFHPHPRTALIVGAGSGNDAAGALRNGVEQVTAVEIDPAIIALGRRYHPERPYSSTRVRVVNDDARSFFATCTERYDVIAFGLLDSHTTTAMTNARLDHYVYTLESLRRARSLLADGGVMVLCFEAQRPYIADRMANTLRQVFGHKPISFRIHATGYGWGGVMFVADNSGIAEQRLAADPRLADRVRRWQRDLPVPISYTTRVATDDWPYIYLQTPSIPLLYEMLAGLLVAQFLCCAALLRVRGLVAGPGSARWHFFFLGAAFLLLEVQNISKAAVVLGNTWQVNAVIISSILVLILLANLIAAKLPGQPPWPAYVAVCATALGLYLVDLSWFGALPYAAKAATVGFLTCLPILFSGLIFIRSFAAASAKDVALGANLMGALVGGLLQSVTFLTGVKALLLIVAGLYAAAFLTRPRERL
ncbi:MAG TPA: hypothetical protein VGZ22_14240 [Isosphaeraceae bacterium]|jgi:spermidine synthase|nr:hypothetical protein [Isosphaeraceae bacterium]